MKKGHAKDVRVIGPELSTASDHTKFLGKLGKLQVGAAASSVKIINLAKRWKNTCLLEYVRKMLRGRSIV